MNMYFLILINQHLYCTDTFLMISQSKHNHSSLNRSVQNVFPNNVALLLGLEMKRKEECMSSDVIASYK